MLEIMYDIPGMSNLKTCKITRDVVDNKARPELIYSDPTPVKKKESKKDDDGSGEPESFESA